MKINKYEILRKFEINKYRILSIHETNFKPGGEVVKEVSYLAQKRLFGFLWLVNITNKRHSDVYDAFTDTLKDNFYKTPEFKVECYFV